MDNYFSYINDHVSIRDVFSIFRISINSNNTALCPFHNDKNPSLHIYDETNQYHCFACGAHGNIFSIIKHSINGNFNDSILWIEENFSYVKIQKKEFNVCIKEQRSVNDEVVKCFAEMNKSEENLLNQFSQEREFEMKFLIQNGISFAKMNKLSTLYGNDIEFIEKLLEKNYIYSTVDIETNVIKYSDFYKHGRVIIPLDNVNGNVEGFLTRAVIDKDTPKYIFNKGLNKGELIYNLYDVKKNLEINIETSISSSIYLVEGVFDALRLKSLGLLSIAVLGSSLTQKQASILIENLRNSSVNNTVISLYLLLDSDIAGLKGRLQSLKNLLNEKLPPYCRIIIILNDKIDKNEDPDNIFKKMTRQEAEDKINSSSYDIFEFLFRFSYDSSSYSMLTKTHESMRHIYDKILDVDSRIRLTKQVYDSLNSEIWKKLVGLNNISKEYDSNFFFNLIRDYIGLENHDKSNEIIKSITELSKMKRALNIAKISYIDENIPLDENTWDRLEIGAEAIFPFMLNNIELRANNILKDIPLITYKFPKNKDENRIKALYTHERLIFQQYILNELLSFDQEYVYKSIPAVRFDSLNNTSQTTGFVNLRNENKVVSFAYQIDMNSINPDSYNSRGMFRPYYECWREYLNYLNDAVTKLGGEKFYFLRLDITKFYDNLPAYSIRNALNNVAHLIFTKKSEKVKFKNYDVSPDQFLDWIISDAFEYRYYDSDTCKTMIKENTIKGIPQGPNLSAYLANISLFTLDEAVLEQINKWGDDPQNAGAIYARYVDDMVIITNSSQKASLLREIIGSQLNDIGLQLNIDKNGLEERAKQELEEELSINSNPWGSFVSEGFGEDLDIIYENCIESDSIDREKAKVILKSMEVNSYNTFSENEDIIESIFKTQKARFNDAVRLIKLIIQYVKKAIPENDLFEKIKIMWNEKLKIAPDDSILLRYDVFYLALVDALLQLKNLKTSNYLNIEERDSLISYIKEVSDYISNSDILKKELVGFLGSSNNKNKLTFSAKLLELYVGENQEINEYVDKVLGETKDDNVYIKRWQYFIAEHSNKLVDTTYSSCKTTIEAFHYFLSNMQRIKSVDDDYNNLKSVWNDIKNSEVELKLLKPWFDSDISDLDEDEKLESFDLLVSIIKSPSNLSLLLTEYIKSFHEFVLLKNHDYLPVPLGVKYETIYGYGQGDNQVCSVELGDGQLHSDDYVDAEVIKGKSRYVLKKIGINGFKPIAFSIVELVDANSEKTISNESIALILSLFRALCKKIIQINNQNEYKLAISHHNVFVKIEDNEVQDIKIFTELCESNLVNYKVWVTHQNDSKRIYEKKLQEVNYDIWLAGQIILDAFSFNDELSYKRDTNYYALLDYVQIISGEKFKLWKERCDFSYNKTIVRRSVLMETFIKLDNLLEKRRFIFNLYITNSFISETNCKISDSTSIESITWQLSRWSSLVLYKHVQKNQEFLEYLNYDIQTIFSRREPQVYGLLADIIYTTSNNYLEGMMILSNALRIRSLILNMTMQILEICTFYTMDELCKFKDREFPYDELGIDRDKCLLIDGTSKTIKDIAAKLIKQEIPVGINNLTLNGTLILLAWLLEIGETSYIGRIRINQGEESNKGNQLSEEIIIYSKILRSLESFKSDMQFEFPFDDSSKISCINLEIYEKMAKQQNKVDELIGFKVAAKASRFFQFHRNKNGYDLTIEGESFDNSPNTILRIEGSERKNYRIEKSIENREDKVWTQTQCDGRIIGISVISEELATIIRDKTQNLEKVTHLMEPQVENIKNINFVDILEKDDIKIVGIDIDLSLVNQNKESIKGDVIDEAINKCEKCSIVPDLPDTLNGLYEIQNDNWDKREKDNNAYDRIAIFQFDGGNSYIHPFDELMNEYEFKLKKYEQKMKLMANEKSFEENETLAKIKKELEVTQQDLHIATEAKMKYSYTEQRRQKMIGKAIEICNKFKVEILVLPEYSVRPETVLFIKNLINDKKYSLSVWAGTFKIYSGYLKYLNENLLNITYYDNEAILPVISASKELNFYNGESCIKVTYPTKLLLKRAKKYPSIAMEELINPYRHAVNPIVPIMKNEPCDNSLFFDARDDVLECICSELFLMSVPANRKTMANVSFQLYKRFLKGKPDKKRYDDTCDADVRTFGDYTALNYPMNKYSRRSIILVPAYTTRPTDHYVIGQAGYLGSGLVTVLANSSHKDARGGSCFIGNNSWDNHKGSMKGIPDYSLYPGIEPGIFKQHLSDSCRGALGEKEQALIICDINPNNTAFNNPNYETAIKPMNLIAHIPFVEIVREYNIKTVRTSLETNDFLCGKCNENKGKTLYDILISAINQLHLSKFKNGEISKQHILESEAALETIGKLIDSKMLVERGKQFNKLHLTSQYSEIPPALIDFAVVDIGKEDCSNQEFQIFVPQKGL